jgi:hypothetical protein
MWPATTISAAVRVKPAEFPETVFRHIETQNEVPYKYASKLGTNIDIANLAIEQGLCTSFNKSCF